MKDVFSLMQTRKAYMGTPIPECNPARAIINDMDKEAFLVRRPIFATTSVNASPVERMIRNMIDWKSSKSRQNITTQDEVIIIIDLISGKSLIPVSSVIGAHYRKGSHKCEDMPSYEDRITRQRCTTGWRLVRPEGLPQYTDQQTMYEPLAHSIFTLNLNYIKEANPQLKAYNTKWVLGYTQQHIPKGPLGSIRPRIVRKKPDFVKNWTPSVPFDTNWTRLKENPNEHKA